MQRIEIIMNMHTRNNKRWVGGIFAFLLLLLACFPAQADSPVVEPDSEDAPENAIFLPIIPFGPHTPVAPIATPTVAPTKSPTAPPPGNPAGDTTYYISPTGDDSRSGLSEAEAWATFNHAWQALYPGDTLILLDGVYNQSLQPNERNGEPGKPITIRAKNDGQAIIDGQNQRVPVYLGSWPGPTGDYFVIEGIVARNSNYHVYRINGNHNILRRVSGYNANTDENAHVFTISWGEHNLIEDCIAQGTGRKMILMHDADNNIVRRCYADWQEWDGREARQCWPWGDGIEVYNASNNIIENSIAYSRTSNWAISVLAQGSASNASIGNKVLGTMALLAGMQEDGITPMEWGTSRPQPSISDCVYDPPPRKGFSVWESGGEVSNNLWQDIFAWGNASLGLSWAGSGNPNSGNNRINRATLRNNGLNYPCGGGWPCQNGGPGTDVTEDVLAHFDSIENSYIERVFVDWPTYPNGEANVYTMNGEGARLAHRYVDGVLTNEPLWPWPMEDRIQAELDFSVTELMTDLIFGTSDLSEIYP
jgi:hypothetical protein